MTHLAPQEPLSPEEIARLSTVTGHEEACIMPAPQDAGLPTINHRGRTPDYRFAYRNARGDVLGYVLRWGDGDQKEIRPATFWKNGKGKGAWACRSWPGARPLFGLDRLASKPDAIVLLVEGEKAAEAVERGPFAEAFKWAPSDVVGVTWPGGTNAITYADFSPLVGREIIILPDNDGPGEQAANALVEALKPVGVKGLRRWRPPTNAPEKWDIADPPPDGCTPEALVEAMLEAPAIAALRIVQTLAEFLSEFDPPHYLVDGLLQHHCLYSLTGKTGAGKTSVAVMLAVLVASKAPGRFGPHEVEPGRVVYIAKENKLDVQMRFFGILNKMHIEPSELNMLVIGDIVNLDQDLPRIAREIGAFGEANLVIADTSISLFLGDNENDNVQARDHAHRLRKLTELPGKPCVVALCHPTKNPTGPEMLLPRGGGGLIAEVDGNLTLWLHDGVLTDLHTAGKFRGPDFEPITFKLETVVSSMLVDRNGRCLPTVVAKAVTEAEVIASEKATIAQEDRLLIAILRGRAAVSSNGRGIVGGSWEVIRQGRTSLLPIAS
jgi:hypothetical protein